jgi:hypothetical protein
MYYNEKDMEGKLVKLGEDDYILHVNNKPFAYKSLSLKNCQAIERGYDLDELAREACNITDPLRLDSQKYKQDPYFKIGFNKGFQKALEILGDKKFSEEDVKKTLYLKNGFDKDGFSFYKSDEEIIQSLQQTEWDVVIEMEAYHDGDFINDGKTHIIEAKLRPRLGSDGCLILKRK